MLSKIIKLEDIKNNYISNPIFKGNYEIGCFMITTIDTFKDQSDMIADLRKELAQKDSIDVNDIKIGLND